MEKDPNIHQQNKERDRKRTLSRRLLLRNTLYALIAIPIAGSQQSSCVDISVNRRSTSENNSKNSSYGAMYSRGN